MKEPVDKLKKNLFHSGNPEGFTLIELLVTLAVSSIVLLIIVQFFISTNQINTVQEKVAATQQNIRIAMEIMSRDIRMAGLNPTGTALNAGFADNGSENNDTDGDSVALRYDLDGDGGCEVDRSYYYDNANERFMIRNGGSFQSLTENGTISSVTFTYTLNDGSNDPDPSASGNLGNIRVVSVSICGKIAGSYSDVHTATYCFTNEIKPRNM